MSTFPADDSRPVPADEASVTPPLARAQALSESGLDWQAARILEDHLSANPTDAEALLALAWCSVRLGRRPEALAAARRAAGIRPHDARLQSQLAWVAVECDEPQAAHQAASQALMIAPDQWDILCSYAKVSREVSGRLWSGNELASERYRAYSAALRAVETGPARPESLTALGWALVDLGLTKDADKAFAAALTLTPGDEELIRARTQCATVQKHRLAASTLSSLLVQDPTNTANQALLRVTIYSAVRAAAVTCILAVYPMLQILRLMAGHVPDTLVTVILGIAVLAGWFWLLRGWLAFRGIPLRQTIAVVRVNKRLSFFLICTVVNLMALTAALGFPFRLQSEPSLFSNPMMGYVGLVCAPLAVITLCATIAARRSVNRDAALGS